eukprot:tig00020685_g12941.t1
MARRPLLVLAVLVLVLGASDASFLHGGLSKLAHELRAFLPVPVAAQATPVPPPPAPHGEVLVWRKTEEVQGMGPTTVSVYLLIPSMTWEIEIRNKQVSMRKPVGRGTQVCVDEKYLLEMLEHDPHLVQYRELIEKILRELGQIPASIFSVCVELADLVVTQTSAKGSVKLVEKLLCFQEKCVKDEERVLGSFDRPLEPAAALAAAADPAPAASEVLVFRKTEEVQGVGPTTVSVYLMLPGLTWEAELRTREAAVRRPFAQGDSACADDQFLLKLVEGDPNLAKYRELIERLLKALGQIPAKVFSICASLRDLEVSQTSAKGTVLLATHVLCIEDKCLDDSERVLGSFDRPLQPAAALAGPAGPAGAGAAGALGEVIARARGAARAAIDAATLELARAAAAEMREEEARG